MRFNYDKTFKIMELRKLRRTIEGTIDSNDTKPFVLFISFSIFLYGLSNIIWKKNAPIPSNFDHKTNIAVFVLGTISLILSYVQYTVKRIIPVLVSGFIISITVTVFSSINENVDKYFANFFITIGISVILILQYVLKVARKTLYKIFGKMVYKINNIDLWFGIHYDEDVYIFNSFLNRYRSKYKRYFMYDGELNDDGRPDGYGTWRSVGYNSEELVGFWKDGIPVGPFVSTVYPCGYITKSVQIFYIKNREEPINEYWYSTRYDPCGIQWGTCNVECSTAGKFYRHLPCVTVENTGYEKDADWCIQNVKTLKNNNNVLFITKDSENIIVNGVNTKKSEIKISIDDSILDTIDNKKEVAIFLHGFNTHLEYMIERVAQLWTLGDLSEHVIPFVHSWPTSKSCCYFRALRRVWDHDTVYDIVELIKSLKKAGVKNVNFICHSMGVAMLIQLSDFFPELFDESELNISSIIIINPDVKIETFEHKYLSNISRFCDFTTIYADESDNALWYSEFFNKYKVVGKHPLDPKLNSLPLEIVDVSWMDTNMHDMRHNFFDINKLMVEDLSDILTKKQRACSRSRLVKREQNVWSFATAPRYVVNK